ncbi:hypothetical protein T4A_12730 [Trichinella pseudospiralis]|uniref:Uncharacterized protein n=1 Tax=Trichinella pseudospiralis TaxID=6337 RepID=A0A0V1DLP2_TRIPS|nr:hypothetical protein T4A_12730 [Trichinella pseudospiralis]
MALNFMASMFSRTPLRALCFQLFNITIYRFQYRKHAEACFD